MEIYNLFVIYDNHLDGEQIIFLNNILEDNDFYANWLNGRLRPNGKKYCKDDIVTIVEYFRDENNNYFILLKDAKGSSLRSLETHLNSRYRKLMRNSRKNNPNQRSYQGQHFYKIYKQKGIKGTLSHNESLIEIIRNRLSLFPTNTSILTTVPEQQERILHEGIVKEYKYLHHSRNKKVREQCLKNANGVCYVCGFNFGNVYGRLGEGFLEVHHINPIGSYMGEHEITVNELRAVCSNCHSMIHRQKIPMDVDKLKRIVNKTK